MNMSFLNITLCYYFFLEAVSQGVVKNNQNSTRCSNSGDIEAYACVLTHKREYVKLIVKVKVNRKVKVNQIAKINQI